MFFLGAGASFGAGAYALVQGGGRLAIPMQTTFWDTFLRFCHSDQNRKTIESFLFRYFLGYARVPTRIPSTKRRTFLRNIDVEEVFTFLSERARAPSTSTALRGYAKRVWKALIDEFTNVFNRFKANAHTRRIYRQFTDNFVCSRDTIVSFNYDIVFERSLLSAYKWHYEGLQFATHSHRILKPHGSINWEDSDPIKITNSPLRALVVAPTHLKFVQTNFQQSSDTSGYLDHAPEIRNIWTIMETEMREAKALVFIGYSFPMADLYFSSVLRSVLVDRKSAPGVAIVNPDALAIRERLRTRFSLDRVGIYFDLQTFVQGSRSQLLSQI